jgi:hypothetical protein
MATITTADGQVIDLSTGETVGKTEAPLPQGKFEIPGSPFDLAKQASYGFNAALFALPDTAVMAIGRALGYDDKNVKTLTKLFNKGDVGAKNSEERYARAIGEGIGANLPLTGVLGYMAASQKLAAPLKADATVMKRVAKETLDFIRKNPKAALAADITSGGAFGATRQYTDENEMGPVAREVLPLAAGILAPAGGAVLGSVASKVSPAAIGARYLKETISPDQSKLSEVGKEISSEYSVLTRPIASMLVPRAERAVGKALSKGEVQESLKRAETLLADLGAQGIKLNTAERTQLPQFLIEEGNLIKNMTPAQLQKELARRAGNAQEFDSIIENFSPKAAMPLEEALGKVRADSEALQTSLLDNISSTKALAAENLAERYAPQNRDVLGNEIRNTILSSGEKTFFNLRNVSDRMGLRRNFTDEDGVPLPTRDSNGVSLFPSYNIEKPINNIVSKYNVLTGPIKEYSPYLANVLGRYKRGQQAKGLTAFEDALTKELTDIFVQRNRPGAGAPGPSQNYFAPSEIAKDTAGADLAFMQQQQGNAKMLVESLLRPEAGTKKRMGMADLNLKPDQQTGLLARSYGIDPVELQSAMTRAKSFSEKAGQVDINFPEAIELMQAATQSRNLAVQRFTDAQFQGRGRQAAQKDLDKVNALYKDVEKMVFDAVPKMSKEYTDFKQVYNDIYGGAYERYLPILIGAKRPTGEFLTANEAVVGQAFKSAENMRDMNILLGETQQGKDLLTRSAMDWVRSKGVLDADGLVNPAKMQSVLNSNKAIVDALPQSVQQGLRDDLAAGKAITTRIAQLETRKKAAVDDELNKIIAKSTREGADPNELITRVLRDPADMNVLVKAMEGSPERLEALRRAVYKSAADPQGKVSITQFLDNANPKSLAALFSPEQLTNLRKIGQLEGYIKSSPSIASIPSPFESTSDQAQRLLGTSIPGLTGLGKSIMEGRTGVTWSTAYLLTRFVGRQEYSILDRVMQRAVEDADFAKALVQQAKDKTPEGLAKRLQKQFGKTGVYIPEVIYNAPRRAAMVDIAEQLQQPIEQPMGEEQPTMAMPPAQAPAPIAPPRPAMPPAPPSRATPAPGQARQQMQSFNQRYPAPPAKGVTSIGPAFPTTPPKPSGNAAMMYQSLFPRDTLGQAIELNKTQQ